MDEHRWAALARLQRRQFGAFSLSQAVALGLRRSTIDKRLRRGRYRELLPGVAIDHGTPDSWEVRAIAAQLWAGGDAVLARGTAGRVHGWPLPGTATAAIHLLTRVRTRVAPAGVVLHRSASFAPDVDEVARGPLRVTTASRTIVDLAGEVDAGQLRDVVVHAVRRDQVDASAVSTDLHRLGRVAGVAAVREILRELSPLHGQCRSWLESAFVDLTAGTGLEPTAMNFAVRDGRGDRRLLDAVYLPEHLPVELDGEDVHGSILDRNDDADREDAVRLDGRWLRFLRFTHADVTRRGDEVLARLERRLSEAGSTRRRQA